MRIPLVYATADVAAWIEGIATALGVLVAVVAALYARDQLLDGRRTERRQRVFDLQARFDAEIFPLLDDLFRFVAQPHETATQQWDAWTDAEPHKQWELCRPLNFFEQVSGEYNIGLLDEQVGRQTLVYELWVTWPRVRWFVEWLRDQLNEQRLLRQWQDAYATAQEIYAPAA